jgi:peptide/nickel transport system permease protein
MTEASTTSSPPSQDQDAGVSRGARRRMTLWQRLLHDRGALFGLSLLVLILVAAIGAPVIAPTSPTDSNVSRRLKPPLSTVPDLGFTLLGTDNLGRDMFSRIIYGARVSLIIGFVAVLISSLLGYLLGILAGYRGGRVDDLIMRLADIQLAFPFILLAIAVVAVIGPGLVNIVLVLGVAGWVLPARVVRAEVLSAREREHVQASRVLGATDLRIVLRHITPNVLPSLVVTSSFAAAQMIIVESALSFLGLGIAPPTPSWGNMLADGQNDLTSGWWVSTMPGVALMLTVLGINLLGDFLRDSLDHRIDV